MAYPSLVLDHGFVRWRNQRQPALPYANQGILGSPPPGVKFLLGSSPGDDHQSIKQSPNTSDPFRITGDQHELITANQGSHTHQPLSPIDYPSPSSGRYWPPSAAGQQHCSDQSPNTSCGSHHHLRVADKDRSSHDQHLRASGHQSPSSGKWQTPTSMKGSSSVSAPLVSSVRVLARQHSFPALRHQGLLDLDFGFMHLAARSE